MEQDPLLEDQNGSALVSEQERLHQHPVGSRSFRSFFFFVLAFAFSIEFGADSLALPMIGLVELMACRRHIDGNPTEIDEQACKVPVVQNEVALVIGCRVFFDALPCGAI